MKGALHGFDEAILRVAGYYEQLHNKAEAIKWYTKAQDCKDPGIVQSAKDAVDRLNK